MINELDNFLNQNLIEYNEYYCHSCQKAFSMLVQAGIRVACPNCRLAWSVVKLATKLGFTNGQAIALGALTLAFMHKSRKGYLES